MKRVFIGIGAVIFTALFLLSGWMIYRQYRDGKENQTAFEDVAALIKEETTPTTTTVQTELTTVTPTEPPIMTAFEKYSGVYMQNTDFVGWISIAGTNIDYPVMQTVDDPDYYLKHSFEKEYSSYGVPYVQGNCDLATADNVVMYGHHMKDGSMFADLCKYTDPEFYRMHPIIRFDTLTGYGEYEIIAVFKTTATDSGFPYQRFVTAEDSAAFDAYIAKCKALSLYEIDVTAAYGDRLITLSTCEYSRTNGRMVIVAKRISGQGGDADA